MTTNRLNFACLSFLIWISLLASPMRAAAPEWIWHDNHGPKPAEGEVRYNSGLVTYDNWQIIVTSWVSAEQQSISNWQSALTAQAAWEQALGKALGE